MKNYGGMQVSQKVVKAKDKEKMTVEVERTEIKYKKF